MSEKKTANGPAWAAIVSAGIGGVIFGIITDLAETSTGVAKLLNWYHPAGSLSGVAISAVVIWALAWAALNARWKAKEIEHPKTLMALTCVLVVLAFVATFPPFYELL